MTSVEPARLVLADIVLKHKIPVFFKLIFDFFFDTSSGECKEPLIIGVTESTITVIRRKRPSIMKYQIWPHSMIQVFVSCVHHKQLVLKPQGEEPIVAVLAECDRSAQEVTETWEKWAHLNFSTSTTEQDWEKEKIRKGKYKLKKGMKDPFEELPNTTENKTSFLIDDTYFSFWLKKEDRYPEKKLLQEENSDARIEKKPCCPHLC